MREPADRGHPTSPEAARLRHVEVVDLRTGHWPRWSRPAGRAHLVPAVAAAPEAG
ncbi:hypothetical protein MHY85_00655 [Cellulomonas sp. ACRRI]|uniref:hypothetical protein n=1 Tax=Cellulomonas sp. ACRRI TaxID=2918188 RepID=UPI001EF31A2C|nr:hypothetical protein [Cellulomonas sp. ACRRI]MCG7284480.1 hypothetical protein [Cellulomonas sp. ACRRI]